MRDAPLAGSLKLNIEFATGDKHGQAANATGKKPNILILWSDDIGTWNISYFSRGMMGYRTPNIDRVAEEG